MYETVSWVNKYERVFWEHKYKTVFKENMYELNNLTFLDVNKYKLRYSIMTR